MALGQQVDLFAGLFGAQQIAIALLEIVVLWLSIAVTILLFRRHDRWAAWLLVPYLLWVGYASALNAAICGAAGALISMIWVIQPFYGIAHSIRCFVIVTAAGLGNLPGVIMAGLGLGVAEQYAGFVFGAELQQFTVVAMLVLVLGLRQVQQGRHRQVVQ